MALWPGQQAQAQSAYGCRDLVSSDVIPSVEGEAGLFYRVDPDLMSFHPLADQTIDQLAALSDRLAARGTTLIYVPLPTKAQAVPQHLPPLARHLGYDPELAATVYDTALNKLRGAGVRSVDARRVLRAAGQGGSALPFFGPDPRLSTAGTQALAQAVAADIIGADGYDALPKTGYQTLPLNPVALPSIMAQQLQEHCSADLPDPTAPVFQTSPALGTADMAGFVPMPGRIALAGHAVATDPALHFAGHLAAATGLDVVHRTVPGDTGLAALTDHLMSDGFQAIPPAFLVWTHPVWLPLARFGSAPMQAALAAAALDCPIVLPLDPARAANSLRADLSALPNQTTLSLFVDADQPLARMARFDFTGGPDGLTRSRSRHLLPDQTATGRFFMPMTSLWPEGAQDVTITLDAPVGAMPRLLACR